MRPTDAPSAEIRELMAAAANHIAHSREMRQTARTVPVDCGHLLRELQAGYGLLYGVSSTRRRGNGTMSRKQRG